MVKNHLKRIFMPKTWKITRKSNVFITRPNPGPHKAQYSVSLNTFFKEMIKYCKTTKEVKQILLNKEVLVDGKRRKDVKAQVGLMDVVTIPSTKEAFRIILSKLGYLTALPIKDGESKLKPSKIANKTIIKGGQYQINFTDGRNILLKKNDYKTGDTLMLSLPEQEVKKHFKLAKGATIILTGGKQIGKVGELTEIVDYTIKFKTVNGEEHETKIEHAFVIGEKKAEIATE